MRREIPSSESINNESNEETIQRRSLSKKIGNLANRLVSGIKGAVKPKEGDKTDASLHALRERRIEGLITHNFKDFSPEEIASFKKDEGFFESEEYQEYEQRKKELRKNHPEIFESPDRLSQLRKQRLSWLLGETNPSREEMELMGVDEGWVESEEGKRFQMLSRDKLQAPERKNYPEIFEEVDEGQINELQKEYINRIKSVEWFQLMEIYEDSYEKADRQIADLISEILGLPTTPDIEYEPKNGMVCGHYNPNNNTIVIRNPERYFRQDDNLHPVARMLNRVGRVNTIAHEMWHAYQENGPQTNTERGEMYETNRRYYVQLECDYEGYRKQLLEVEAFKFGDATSNIVEDYLTFKWDKYEKGRAS